MKKVYFILSSLLICTTLAFSIYNFLQAKKLKIACIDTVKVLNASREVSEYSKIMEQKNYLFKSRLDTLSSEFEASIKAYEKKRASLSQKDMIEEEKKIRNKQEEYARFNASNEEILKKEEMKLMEKVLERVNTKIAHFAKNQGYSAVFGANSSGAVVYAGDYIDITEDIIQIIND